MFKILLVKLQQCHTRLNKGLGGMHLKAKKILKVPGYH